MILIYPRITNKASQPGPPGRSSLFLGPWPSSCLEWRQHELGIPGYQLSEIEQIFWNFILYDEKAKGLQVLFTRKYSSLFYFCYLNILLQWTIFRLQGNVFFLIFLNKNKTMSGQIYTKANLLTKVNEQKKIPQGKNITVLSILPPPMLTLYLCVNNL